MRKTWNEYRFSMWNDENSVDTVRNLNLFIFLLYLIVSNKKVSTKKIALLWRKKETSLETSRSLPPSNMPVSGYLFTKPIQIFTVRLLLQNEKGPVCM